MTKFAKNQDFVPTSLGTINQLRAYIDDLEGVSFTMIRSNVMSLSTADDIEIQQAVQDAGFEFVEGIIDTF